MAGPVSPRSDPRESGATASLRKAALIFDNAPRPQTEAPVRLGDEDIRLFTPDDVQALVRAKAQELRQLAALCSMAARRVQEMENGPAHGTPQAEALAELKAVCDFLHDRFLRASS